MVRREARRLSAGDARHAIYAAPDPAGALWRFGSAVLGYDAARGEDVPPLVPGGFAAGEWAALTAAPRTYGFHATLKAPFRLAPGTDEAGLRGTLARFAASQTPPPPLRLAVRALGAFVALVPEETPAELLALEAATVRDFEPFRAPLTPAERARRLAAPLTPREAELLDAHGYPYVLDRFRVHMTLTGPLPEARRADALAGLTRAFAASGAAVPWSLDALALLRQDAPGARFRIVARAPLG